MPNTAEQSILPPSEQEVIQNFDVELQRVDIEKEEHIVILKNYQSQSGLKNYLPIMFSNFYKKSNSYLVYNGHIVAIYYIQPYSASRENLLPQNLGNLKELLYLVINNTKIKKIPPSIGKLKKLVCLHIDQNFDLISLPESLGNLTQLARLYLANNNLTSLPESFGNITNLSSLSLRNNNLTLLPKSFKKLKLYEMDISGNPLRSFSNIYFEELGFYEMTIKNLTNFGRNLLGPWESRQLLGPISDRQDKERIKSEYDFYIDDSDDMDDHKRIFRNFIRVAEYYRKSPFQLAKQYCDDPASMTPRETERLIWEANSSIREILEGIFPPDNEIIKKINDRLSISLNNGSKIII